MKERFNNYVRSLEYCSKSIKKLTALLRHKNISMLKANQALTFGDIELCIAILQTLKESLQKEVTQND